MNMCMVCVCPVHDDLCTHHGGVYVFLENGCMQMWMHFMHLSHKKKVTLMAMEMKLFMTRYATINVR